MGDGETETERQKERERETERLREKQEKKTTDTVIFRVIEKRNIEEMKVDNQDVNLTSTRVAEERVLCRVDFLIRLRGSHTYIRGYEFGSSYHSFIVADTQLYKRLCPSVCRSV